MSEASNSITVAEICDQVGRRVVAKACGIGLTAVSNAVVTNVFPAKWYLVVKRLCERADIECPDTLFSFAPPPSQEDNCAEGETT